MNLQHSAPRETFFNQIKFTKDILTILLLEVDFKLLQLNNKYTTSYTTKK